MHCCIRVYNNGDRVVEWRSATDLPGWLEYNGTFRFGQALFVDGECRRRGYLETERCQALAQSYQEELATGKLQYRPRQGPVSLGIDLPRKRPSKGWLR